MRFCHFIKRNSSFAFVCRIPKDLQRHFPKSTFWTALKAEDEKTARTLATAHEFIIQRIFSMIRIAMLPKDLQDWLIASYFESGLEILRSVVFKELFSPTRSVHKIITDELNKSVQASAKTKSEKPFAQRQMELEASIQNNAANFHSGYIPPRIQHAADDCITIYNKVNATSFKPTKAETKTFGLRLLETENKLTVIEQAVLNSGSTYHIDSAIEAVKLKTGTKFITLQDAVNSYQVWYKSDNPDAKTYESEVVTQCDMLLELLGENTSISAINNFDAVTNLINKLHIYPKNKVKIFKDKSFEAIVRSNVPYDKLSKSRAQKYLARLYAIIQHLINSEKLKDSNKIEGRSIFTKRERAESQPDRERLSYDKADMERLVDALCTQPLYSRGENRDERFWLILVGIFHGLRTGNIIGLTKEMLFYDNGTIPCFDLTKYKRGEVKTADARRIKIAINSILIELGLLRWIDSINRQKLFRDTGPTFSRWYNRHELDKVTGNMILGFEHKFITEDPKKCFYSNRHLFQEACEDADIDVKHIKAMVGHRQDQRDQHRSRYTSPTSPAKQISFQPAIVETFKGLGIDIARLKKRADELFFTGGK